MDFILVIFGVLGLLWVAVSPFLAERGRPAITDADRARAKGEWVALSQGVTYYKWTGAARGPVAILIHGLTTPMIGMETVAEGMGKLGYRVLMYDLYGRGLSDAPKGKQDRAFFLRQLAELCGHLDLREDLTIVGYSMGGSIATAFAVENPHVVKQVMMIAGAGVKLNESRFSAFCRKTPVLGDWAHAMFARNRMIRELPQKGKDAHGDLVLRAQRRQLERRGYLPAILASRRGILCEIMKDEHRQLSRKGIPVIAVWARQDAIIPLRAIAMLAEWNRNARQEMVDEADHALPYTHGTELVDAMRSALSH